MAEDFIIHGDCIKGEKYYFKTRVVAKDGATSLWSEWGGLVAGDNVGPPEVESGHIESAADFELGAIHFIVNDSYNIPGDFKEYRVYFVSRHFTQSETTWQSSYADSYQVYKKGEDFLFTEPYNYITVWDMYVGVVDIAGNETRPNSPQEAGFRALSVIGQQDFSSDIVFNSSVSDTVGWSSGEITMANLERFSVEAGNTGAMGGPTYIYLDKNVSETVLQTTLTASGAQGPLKRLIAVAQDSQQEAIFQTFGGRGGLKIRAQNIEAYSISGHNISAYATIIAGTGQDVAVLDGSDPDWRIYAGSRIGANAPFRVNRVGQVYMTEAQILTSSGSSQRIEIRSSDNTLRFFNDSNEEVVILDDNLQFGLPGIRIMDGSFIADSYINGSITYFNPGQFYSLSVDANVAPIIGVQSGLGASELYAINGFCSITDSITRSQQRIGVYGLSRQYHVDNQDVHIGVKGLAVHAGISGGDAIGIWGEAITASGIAWAGYFAGGNVHIDNDFFVGGNVILYDTLTVSGESQFGGRGSNVNCMTVDDDGYVEFKGRGRVTRDVIIPVAGTGGGASVPTFDNSFFPFDGYAFGIGDDLHYVFEVPHGCDTSEDMILRIHYFIDRTYADESGELRWRSRYRVLTEDGSEPVDSGGTYNVIELQHDIPATAKGLKEQTVLTIPAAHVDNHTVIGLDFIRTTISGGSDPGGAPAKKPIVVELELEWVRNSHGDKCV